MAGYSIAVLDEIRSSVDLVDLIGRFVNLRKAGASFKGLCPFHAEKTPSFVVNPKKGVFHCFGCGAGGDAFGFLMRQDRLSFPEAVRALAKQTGVALPDERGSAGDSGREELYRIMDLAARFYSEALGKPGGEQARQYLDRRGIDPEVARSFRLGYALEGWDGLLGFMRTERVPVEALENAGLVVRRDGGGHYDRFRSRLMFAIRDVQGRVVAFGGRAFGDEQPKYLNSPETPVYTKGNLLYALDLARTAMRDRNRALLVEGYVDCLMAHQHGFTETVAALGTAFTADQLRLLRRNCDHVITFFDADTAGQKAADRAEALLEATAGEALWDPTSGGSRWINRTGEFSVAGGLRVKVALLPAGEDPDTFLRKHGAAAFTERIEAARSILLYALDRATQDSEGATGPRARANAFARATLMLAKVADAYEATELSREVAFKLGVEPAHLVDEARRLQAALRRPATAPPASPATPVPTARERDLVVLLLGSASARAALLHQIEDDDLRHAPLRAIVAVLKQRPDASPEKLLTDLADDSARNLLAALLVEEREVEEPRALIDQFAAHLEREHRLRRQRQITRSISEAQTAAGAAATPRAEFVALHQESKVVYELTGGVAQSLERRDAGPQGAETHE
ncbi:MAG: DNA primase [Candidatus Rokuibacteriota bacterium]